MLLGRLMVCVLFSLVVSPGPGHSFLSVRDMERLFDTEQSLATALENYVALAKFNMEVLREHSKKISRIKSEIDVDSSYLKNPVNAYSLVKRLARQWRSSFDLLPGSSWEEEELPNESVLSEMISGLVEWQLEKGVATEALARGWVEGVKPHANLTAGDCLDIAVHCYNTRKLQLALEWLQETLYKIRDDRDNTASLMTTLEYTFLTKCLKGDLKGSTEAFLSLKKGGPNWYTPSNELSKEYQLEEVKECESAALREKKSQADGRVSVINQDDSYSGEICLAKAQGTTDDLVCHLVYIDNKPLTPLKLELLHETASVVLLHDAISDAEILHIKQFALNRMKPLSLGINGPIDFLEAGLALTLDRRMSRMTNLKLELFGENNQVTVVGPEGSYRSTNDFHPQDGNETDPQRTVIGNVIYFLNDVPRGGHTVFPRLGLAVTPQKGSALFFWTKSMSETWNTSSDLLQRGECPVLTGSKWVLTKSIVSKEQE